MLLAIRGRDRARRSGLAPTAPCASHRHDAAGRRGGAGAGKFPAGDAARHRSGGARRALGGRSLGGGAHRRARRRRHHPAARHRPDRGRRRPDPRGHRLSRADRGAVAAGPRAPRARGARADGGAARDLATACTSMSRRVQARSEEIGWRSAVHESRRHHENLERCEPCRAQPLLRQSSGPGGTCTGTSSRPRRREDRGDAGRGAARGRGGEIVSAEAEGGRAVVRFRRRAEAGRGRPCGWRDRQLHGARRSTSSAPASHLLDALLAAGSIRPIPCASASTWMPSDRTLDAEGGRPTRFLQSARSRAALSGERRGPRHPRPGRARRGAAGG